jgi:mono/diheme cytochrome c family protein
MVLDAVGTHAHDAPNKEFMKIRYALIPGITAILLTACNFTLAADVTPPPDYVPPAPIATLGPLFPASAPDIENGAAIYVEKCAPCHGDTGLGDGPDGKALPVSVAALGLPATAHKASPSAWYTMVTQGNLERFMPPFASLNDQERWDVVAYALTLHTTEDEIEKGKSIFESTCADCAEKFTDQETMSALSADALVEMIKNGNAEVPAFGSSLPDEDAYAVAAYIRTLAFASLQPAPTVVPATPTDDSALSTPAPTDSGTPSADITPVEATPQAEAPTEAPVLAGIGTVSGRVDNQTGEGLPSDLKVTLHVYDHSGDQTSGPQEIMVLEGTVEADDVYRFENVEIPENRIFLADVEQNGITYQSEFAIVEAGATEVTVPDIKLYGTTTEFTDLEIESINIHFNYTTPDTIQVILVYTMLNTGGKTIIVDPDTTSQELPFIKAPANTSGLGFQVTQDSAIFYGSADGSSFAMPPTEQTYGLVAFTDLPVSNKFEFSQEFVLPVNSISFTTPEGVTLSGDEISDSGPITGQDENGQEVYFQTYSTGSLKANDTLTFTVSGKPKSAGSTAGLTQNQMLLIGAGALGFMLILAGVWMYLRDRNRVEEDDDEADDEFEDSESVLDAIIALDDLHRAGKLGDEAYHKRRDELKAKLKE